MHWAAAAAHLDVIRRLADAGGDVTGRGDDHGLEVIGWATCWDGADDGAHREAAEFLVSRGARHHIFSAIALNLAGEVRRIVAADPTALNRRMSRHEGSRLPLHFAVAKNRREMAALLLELGADPLGADEAGYPATTYATSLESDRPVLERIRELTAAELLSADRGSRPTRGRDVDLLATVSLGDWPAAERLLHDSPQLASSGVLHLLAKRNDLTGARWLLERGADPNARWNHWDALVTPLHLAILGGHAEMTRLLLDAGADPTIRDDKHDADALDWAGFFRRDEIVELLKQRSSA
jgi:ankyrin repeat protein